MPVQAQHLVVQRFGRQRISPEQEQPQIRLDDKYLVLVDWSKQPGGTLGRENFDVLRADFLHPAFSPARTIVLIEFRIDVQHPGLPGPIRPGGQYRLPAQFEQMDIGYFHKMCGPAPHEMNSLYYRQNGFALVGE
jgi:hypothetical protein